MSIERKPPDGITEIPTIDGGLVTLERGSVLHLHYQSDEELQVFGLAVGVDFRDDRDYAHILEHLVMRQEVDGDELVRVLELNSSTRWWSAYTSSRCISFEVSGYTSRCVQRSAARLCKALFEMQVTEESYRSEADANNGRLTTEESAQQSNLRLGLLVDLSNRVLGTHFSTQTSVPCIDDIQAWHSSRVHPDQVLWFTSGPQTFAEARNTVACLRAAYSARPSAQAACTVAAVQEAPRGGSRPAYPGSVLAWQGPSPLHQLPEYALLKTLHTAALRHTSLQATLVQLFGAGLFPHTSTVFGDLSPSFVTLGLRQAGVPDPVRIAEVADRLRDAAGRSQDAAREVLDSWLIRKLKYYPGRRPKGSRLFAELREGALAGGDVYHLAKPEALVREVLARIKDGFGTKLLDAVYKGEALCLE